MKNSHSVNKNECIGCGICAVACPKNCISIELDTKLSYRPAIDSKECINCGVCSKVCYVNSRKNFAIAAAQQNAEYGFPDSAQYIHGYVNNDADYMKSASGGLLSALLVELLKTKKIDAVVHSSMCKESASGFLGRGRISYTEDDINENRGSFYGPVEFSSVLKEINVNPNIHSVAIVCLPCVCNSINLLKKINRNKTLKIKYIFTLMCGHNANGRHAEFLLNDYPVKDGLKRDLSMREKENVSLNDSFNLSVSYSDGSKIVKPITSCFKPLWRGFWNSEKECYNCIDFTGAGSDASFKDAWKLKPLKYSTGESAVIIRSPEIFHIFQNMEQKELVKFEPVDKTELITSQWATIKERYYNSLRISKSSKGSKFLKIGYMMCRLIKRLSIIGSDLLYKKNRKMQLFISGFNGKILSAFVRFTNERRK